MNEIDKLRQRLKNVERNTTEYKMSIVEAKNLLDEIEALQKQHVVKQEPEPTISPVPHIWDGGSF